MSYLGLLNRQWDIITSMVFATTVFISLAGPFLIGRSVNIDRRDVGHLAFQLLKYGEIPIVLFGVYLVIIGRIRDTDIADRIRLVMAFLIVIHILLFTLATGGVILHTYIHYLNGQICGANNILIGVLATVNILEYLMWEKNWFIEIPDNGIGKFLLWFYWIFVLSYLGPVMAHISAVRNG